MTVRVAYLDLDGTLTRDGSMFHGARGPTLAGARAIFALHRAHVAIVPASGRTAAQLREVARLLGARDFIAELGSLVRRDGVETVTYDRAAWDGAHGPRATRLVEALGARFCLVPHEPWHSLRAHTILLRGAPGLASRLRSFLAEQAPGLDAIDNGPIEGGLHAYHVLPAGVSKEAAVARDLRERGAAREEAVAFGDSEGDRALARVVGTFYHIGGPDGDGVVGIATPCADGLLEAVRHALGLRH